MLRRRATEGHVDYMRQLEGPKSWKQIDLDPKVHPRPDEVRQSFRHPELMRQPAKDELLPLETLASKALSPSFKGRVGVLDVEPFGRITVEHGDIFEAQADAVMLPMAPSLMPYRGLGLEAFDRGGKQLVEEAFKAAFGQDKDRLLQPGDALLASSPEFRAGKVLFVIVPWFWQGSALDAAKRLRHCVRLAFREASAQGLTSLAVPNLGGGLYGYEPKSSCRILAEEAMEALLQIEDERPTYALQHIAFVDRKRDVAEQLGRSLVQVGHRWLPELRLTTAAEYWSNANKRLLLLPVVPPFLLKRHRVKFRRSHGVKRNAFRHYKGNMVPWLWRVQRVQQPPPLLVYKATNATAPAEVQLPARPHYFRGVTHILYPARRSGFQVLRRSAQGKWVGRNVQYNRGEDFRPRA